MSMHTCIHNNTKKTFLGLSNCYRSEWIKMFAFILRLKQVVKLGLHTKECIISDFPKIFKYLVISSYFFSHAGPILVLR